MTETFANRLAANRHAQFVGRTEELAAFAEAMKGTSQAAVFYVHGPGGIGKSTLLREFAGMAGAEGFRPVWVDARELDGTPDSLQRAAGTVGEDSRVALFLDTCELLGNLDGWLRSVFLPGLPAGALVVMASRRPPSSAWRGDPGWAALLNVMPLRNLGREEGATLLSRRGIPPTLHDEALQFTHGHPLALALVADLVRGGAALGELHHRRGVQNVVSELVDQFVEAVPSELHRDALHLCAHARATTEELLAGAFGEDEAAALFAWLRDLSFISIGPDGLFPHDLARDALDIDLRWRSPRKYRELHAAVRRWVLRRIEEAGPVFVAPIFYDLLFLHRHNPVMAAYTSLQEAGTLYLDVPRPEEFDAILRFTLDVEGPESADICAYWLRQQPSGFRVFRGAEGEAVGFVAGLAFPESVTVPVEDDPALAQIVRYVRETAPLRPGEHFWVGRFWVYPSAYQQPSPAQDLVYAWSTLVWMQGRGMAQAVLTCAFPDRWAPFFSHLNFTLAEGHGYEVGGRRYGFFVHDWRVQGFADWLDMMGENELLTTERQVVERPVAAPELVVLSEDDFRRAARDAIKTLHLSDRLAANPLARSRLARGDGSPLENLQEAVRLAARQLSANPRDEKLFRTFERTYLAPAPTQEAAAEVLNLPWSTYRRYLTAAVERVVESLWQEEIGAASELGTD